MVECSAMRMAFFCIGMIFPLCVHAQVVISEVMWAGSPLSTADEWLEIVNVSEGEQNLSGWTLKKKASDGGLETMYTFEEDAVLQAGQYMVIANYSADNSVLEREPDIVTTSVSLTNTKLYLQLTDETGETVDTVDDGVGAPFAGSKDPYASMERISLSSSGEDPNNWKTAEVSMGFDDATILGTPGESIQFPSSYSSYSSSLSSQSSNLSSQSSQSSNLSSQSSQVSNLSSQSSQVSNLSSQSSYSSYSSSSSTPNPTPSPNPAPHIIISELLPSPKGSDDYEWIEVANKDSVAVDITGWILKRGTRSFTIPPRSASGYILQPGEHTLFFHYQTGLTLPGDEGQVFLYNGDTKVDDLPYSPTGEDISFGRDENGSRALYCIPTPRAPNIKINQKPSIGIQSGRSTDYIKVTLNLEAQTDAGSLKSAQCHWDFGDRTVSDKCNPPSHTWDYYGVYDVVLTVKNVCGYEVDKHLDVVVLEKKKKQFVATYQEYIKSKASSSTEAMKSSEKSSIKSSSVHSVSSSKFSKSTSSYSSYDQKMYTNNSSSLSIQNQHSVLPVRIKNVPEYAVLSSQSSQEIIGIYKEVLSLSQEEKSNTGQVEDTQNQGLPWALLFSQSALWLVVAGKRLL